MQEITSEPVLLVINADTCSHCTALIEKKDLVTQAVKIAFPKLRNVWLSLDKLSLPWKSPIPIPHFPIIFYFPKDVFAQYIAGDHTHKVWVMDRYALAEGSRYDVDGIIRWLNKVVESQDRSDDHDKWSSDVISDDIKLAYESALIKDDVKIRNSRSQMHHDDIARMHVSDSVVIDGIKEYDSRSQMRNNDTLQMDESNTVVIDGMKEYNGRSHLREYNIAMDEPNSHVRCPDDTPSVDGLKEYNSRARVRKYNTAMDESNSYSRCSDQPKNDNTSIQSNIQDIVISEVQRFLSNKCSERLADRKLKRSRSQCRRSRSRSNTMENLLSTKIYGTDVSIGLDSETSHIVLSVSGGGGKTTCSINGMSLLEGLGRFFINK